VPPVLRSASRLRTVSARVSKASSSSNSPGQTGCLADLLPDVSRNGVRACCLTASYVTERSPRLPVRRANPTARARAAAGAPVGQVIRWPAAASAGPVPGHADIPARRAPATRGMRRVARTRSGLYSICRSGTSAGLPARVRRRPRLTAMTRSRFFSFLCYRPGRRLAGRQAPARRPPPSLAGRLVSWPLNRLDELVPGRGELATPSSSSTATTSS